MKLEAAIFDLDGTLLDSMPIWQGLGEKYLLQKKLQPAPGLHDALKMMSLPQAAQHFRAAYGLHEDEETIIGEIETLIADLRTQIQDAGQMEAVVVAAYDATKAKLEDLSDAELKAVASEVSEWET